MKFEVWVVGKNEKAWISEEVAIYENRIKRYIPFEYLVILPKTKQKIPSIIKSQEATDILNRLKPSDYLILLDEKGKRYSSVSFSAKINKLTFLGNRKVIFLIGGAFGFAKEIYDRMNEKISLSDMTFTHQMARILILEQIYRGFSILRNEPYHNL